MRTGYVYAATVGIFALTASGALAATEEVVTIDSRPDVTVGLIVTPPAEAPAAAVILFAGGGGKLKLWRGGGTRGSCEYGRRQE